jgi:hypothetical protein
MPGLHFECQYVTIDVTLINTVQINIGEYYLVWFLLVFKYIQNSKFTQKRILHLLQIISKKFRTYKKKDLRARLKYLTNKNIQLMENLRHLKFIQNKHIVFNLRIAAQAEAEAIWWAQNTGRKTALC